MRLIRVFILAAIVALLFGCSTTRQASIAQRASYEIIEKAAINVKANVATLTLELTQRIGTQLRGQVEAIYASELAALKDANGNVNLDRMRLLDLQHEGKLAELKSKMELLRKDCLTATADLDKVLALTDALKKLSDEQLKGLRFEDYQAALKEVGASPEAAWVKDKFTEILKSKLGGK